MLHTLAFGCSGRLKTLLAAPALFYAHGVLAGWVPHVAQSDLDRQDKVDNWGCSLEYALARTVRARDANRRALGGRPQRIAEHRAAHGSFLSLLFKGCAVVSVFISGLFKGIPDLSGCR